MGVIAGGTVIEGHPDEQLSRAGSDSAKGRNISVEALISAKALRQGALQVTINRASDQALTAWDGNPDCGVKVIATNRSDHTAGLGAERGLDVQARNRGANINWVNGLNVNARNDSGMQAVSLWGVQVRVENYGNVGTDIVGIDVNLSDENSNADPHTKHGILIRSTDASGMGAVDAAIKVSHTSANGFAAFAELATDVADGAVASAKTPTGNATEALIIKIGNNLRYIPCYAVVGFGG